MKRFAVVLLGLAVLAGGWFFASPLFIDRSVDEGFDFVLDDGQIDRQKVMEMPADIRQAMRSEIMTVAADAPDKSAADKMPSTLPRAIARGTFADADAIHKGSGSATLYQLPDGTHVVRFEDFRTTNGPALVVYLAKHSSPARAKDVTDHGYTKLGELKGNIGNQNYTVPSGVDISQYNSVVIWCELFGVLFSPAPLSRT